MVHFEKGEILTIAHQAQTQERLLIVCLADHSTKLGRERYQQVLQTMEPRTKSLNKHSKCLLVTRDSFEENTLTRFFPPAAVPALYIIGNQGHTVLSGARELTPEKIEEAVRYEKLSRLGKKSNLFTLDSERLRRAVATNRAAADVRMRTVQGNIREDRLTYEYIHGPSAKPKNNQSTSMGNKKQSYKTAKLLFRNEHGGSAIHTVDADAKLSELREFVAGEFQGTDIQLVLTIPPNRRLLTEEDNGRSVKQLGMVPSATVLVRGTLPRARQQPTAATKPSVAINRIGQSWLAILFAWLLFPLSWLFSTSKVSPYSEQAKKDN